MLRPWLQPTAEYPEIRHTIRNRVGVKPAVPLGERVNLPKVPRAKLETGDT